MADGPREFGAARVGHDTERAEFVAAFLHRDKSRNAARANCRRARCGEVIELVVNRKIGVDRGAVPLGARQQVGQAMITLRAEHQIDRGRAADNFFALGLRHAAGDCDDHPAPLRNRRLFQTAHTAKLGVDLLGRLLADMAGVEDDQVGIVGARSLDVASRRQGVGHAPRIINVHLAAERLDVELAGSFMPFVFEP